MPVGLYWLVLEYSSWYTGSIVIISVFNALSIGSGLVAAVLLCMKQEVNFLGINKQAPIHIYHGKTMENKGQSKRDGIP